MAVRIEKILTKLKILRFNRYCPLISTTFLLYHTKFQIVYQSYNRFFTNLKLFSFAHPCLCSNRRICCYCLSTCIYIHVRNFPYRSYYISTFLHTGHIVLGRISYSPPMSIFADCDAVFAQEHLFFQNIYDKIEQVFY